MMAERTVYLVTSGDYSDYGVEAVFSSLKKAYAYIGNRTDMDIEPFQLNGGRDECSIRRLWRVRMDKQGKAEWCSPTTLNRKSQEPQPPQLWNRLVIFEVMAKTEKQAIKAANEQRTQLIALNRWPTEDGYLGPRRR